jgi:membrane-associated phospholipid phosphatase
LLQSKEYHHFRIAIAFSVIMAIVLAVFIWIYGKNDSFLIINKSNHPAADYVFKYWTYLGDGIIWVPLVLYSLILKREYLVAILAALIISTILTHVMKRLVFPDELRPLGVLVDRVRTVDGVEVHRAHSFPSGHTSTAFTMALLLAFRFARIFATIFFPLVAFFVGYSRVYLAQHFVTDVFAGMLIGIVSAYLSLLIYVAYRKKTDRKKELSTTIGN